MTSDAAGMEPRRDAAIKRFRDGTHRVIRPEQTVERLRPLLQAFGITRLANVTGLDHIGIPVVVACRPNSRSLSVSQGKGLTLAAAQASALMESIESHHAERISRPLLLGSYDELRRGRGLVDPGTLPRLSVSRFHPAFRTLWIEGRDLARDAGVWLPYELVHLDLTLPLPEGSGCFPLGSNGLASGNHPLEATVHGICEVVERDAFALWQFAGGEELGSTRLDLDSVNDVACRTLLDRFAAADVLAAAWEITSDVGVPAFHAMILDRETDPLRPLYPSPGLGCHPTPGVALFRALAEAAQSRLTRISSSRDDVPRAEYELTRNPDLLERIRGRMQQQRPTRRFADVLGFDGDCLDDDLDWLLGRLAAAGLPCVIAVDLGVPGLGLAVVRVVVPGLEPKPGNPGYAPGPRAQAVIARRQQNTAPDAEHGSAPAGAGAP